MFHKFNGQIICIVYSHSYFSHLKALEAVQIYHSWDAPCSFCAIGLCSVGSADGQVQLTPDNVGGTRTGSVLFPGALLDQVMR